MAAGSSPTEASSDTSTRNAPPSDIDTPYPNLSARDQRLSPGDQRARPRRCRRCGMLLAPLVGMLVLAASALAAPEDQITPRPMPVPGRTEWRPRDCRSVPFSHPVLLPRTAFRRAHGDLESTNEVDLAYAPVFAREWIAERSLYQVTTPAFDGAGNLYM